MELRSSAALAWREGRGRAGRAAAKRCGGMGVEVQDMGLGRGAWGFGLLGVLEVVVGLGWDWGGEALGGLVRGAGVGGWRLEPCRLVQSEHV